MATKKSKKTFVLDTSVILYDHSSIRNFEENDVVIPITVLEELDNFKKGNDTKNFEAREFIRYIDKISENGNISEGIAIDGSKKGKLTVLMNQFPKVDACKVFADNKNDHKILNAALFLSEQNPQQTVVLVSKDINLRIKAKSLNLKAEDYETGKIKDIEGLYTGKTVVEVNPKVISDLYENAWCEKSEVIKGKIEANHYFILKSGKKSALAYYNAETDRIEQVVKETHYGISPKNAEQVFALHAVLNQDVKLVSIQGVAGTGKTLLSLVGALAQKKEFHQIYLARPIVPLSNKDIGFLPGDIKSKISPYMEPLMDNLKFIKNQFKESQKEQKVINQMLESEKIVITPLAYIRGRSLSNTFFIVDEAQNLTPHEVKTIISRAGENTKIIFTGDIYQIDTPYLDTMSNGLSYLIDKIRNQPLYAHITLEKGERSELANLANDYL